MEYNYAQVSGGYRWNSRRFISLRPFSKSPRFSSSIQTLSTNTNSWLQPIGVFRSIFMFLRAMCSTYVLVCHSALRHSILNIVFLCSKKQVVWANAFSVVALMANKKTFWYLSVAKSVRKTMCVKVFLFGKRKYTVSLLPNIPLPLPTKLTLNNFFPKPFFNSHYQIVT